MSKIEYTIKENGCTVKENGEISADSDGNPKKYNYVELITKFISLINEGKINKGLALYYNSINKIVLAFDCKIGDKEYNCHFDIDMNMLKNDLKLKESVEALYVKKAVVNGTFKKEKMDLKRDAFFIPTGITELSAINAILYKHNRPPMGAKYEDGSPFNGNYIDWMNYVLAYTNKSGDAVPDSDGNIKVYQKN